MTVKESLIIREITHSITITKQAQKAINQEVKIRIMHLLQKTQFDLSCSTGNDPPIKQDAIGQTNLYPAKLESEEASGI